MQTRDEINEKKDIAKVNYAMFKQYTGLEIAMSFNSFNIFYYWSTRRFAGKKDF